MLSKSMIPFETSLEKSKKHRAIALAALGGFGGLGQLWEALAELWEVLGSFGRIWRTPNTGKQCL